MSPNMLTIFTWLCDSDKKREGDPLFTLLFYFELLLFHWSIVIPPFLKINFIWNQSECCFGGIIIPYSNLFYIEKISFILCFFHTFFYFFIGEVWNNFHHHIYLRIKLINLSILSIKEIYIAKYLLLNLNRKLPKVIRQKSLVCIT